MADERVRRGLASAIALLSGLSAVALLRGSAGATAPLTRAAPAVAPVPVERAAVERSLGCQGAAHADHAVVVLVPGTGQSPEASFGTGYLRALPTAGFDSCTLHLPDRGLGDIQRSAAYLAEAVRLLAGSGRRVAVVAHSQGGLVARWAVRRWPDLASDVDDVVMLTTPNAGLPSADRTCLRACPPAVRQMRSGSHFLAVLGAEAPPGPVGWTAIVSATDPLVDPAHGELGAAEGIVVQAVCPGRRVDHASVLVDAAVFAVVVDALTHVGPADPARVDHRACGQGRLPGASVHLTGDPAPGDPAPVTIEPPLA